MTPEQIAEIKRHAEEARAAAKTYPYRSEAERQNDVKAITTFDVLIGEIEALAAEKNLAELKLTQIEKESLQAAVDEFPLMSQGAHRASLPPGWISFEEDKLARMLVAQKANLRAKLAQAEARAAEKRCPCQFDEIDACNQLCPCKQPVMSGACLRCAHGGSAEQQLAKARMLVQKEKQ